MAARGKQPMSRIDNVPAHAEIRAMLAHYHQAMTDGRADVLDELLDEAHSLVQITGYVQPKAEWLGVIRSHQFDYHRIVLEEEHLTIHLSGDQATLRGRGIFEATIYGVRRPWRLQFVLDIRKHAGEWKIMHARYDSD